MMPTVTPPVISADKSFFTLYFGNQRIIGARQTRRERKPFHEHEQEAILWKTFEKGLFLFASSPELESPFVSVKHLSL